MESVKDIQSLGAPLSLLGSPFAGTVLRDTFKIILAVT